MSENRTANRAPQRRAGPGPGGPGGPSMMMPGEKPKNFRATLNRLLAYLKPYRLTLVVVLFFAIASTVFSIWAPKVNGQAVNKLTEGIVAKMSIESIEKIQSDGEVKAMLQMMQIPAMADAQTSEERAVAFEKFIGGIKKLPKEQLDKLAQSTGQNQSGTMKLDTSDENLARVTAYIRATNGHVDFEAFGWMLVKLLGLYVLSSGFAFVMQYMMSSVSQRTTYQLRKDVDEKLARLPLKFFDSRTHGEILSRMTNDIDTIAQTLQQNLTTAITSVVSLVGYVVMMLTISPALTGIVLATLPLYVVATMFTAKASQKYFASQQKHLGEMSGHVEEMFTGHKVVKAFSYEEKSIARFNDSNEKLFAAGWKAQFVSGIMWPVMSFISNLGYVFICVVGGLFAAKKTLELGDITAFIQYSRSFTQPIMQMANIANIIQSTIACAERAFELLDEPEQSADPENAVVVAEPTGAISFNNIKFGYTPDKVLMENIDIHVQPGQTIAVVGPTGAGKTTLVNLLMRFYEVDGGSITVDGVDTRHMRRGDLRHIFGMVLQDTWLFKGTIRENIAYGRTGASEEEIVAAAKAAHADRFIRTLPEGYDTELNEEASNISQGQKQLLTIARAILADPAILILDEATSSVDTRTELIIQRAMKRLMRGRTSFVIAHRLSTIRDADLILVMNHGSIIEQGTHAELLEAKGFYADLYNSQFTGAYAEEQAV